MVTQRPLEALFMVRVHAGQPEIRYFGNSYFHGPHGFLDKKSVIASGDGHLFYKKLCRD